MGVLGAMQDREDADEQDALLARIVGQQIVAARRVICGRPYSQDIVLDLGDGTTVSMCGEWDENTMIREGDHGR